MPNIFRNFIAKSNRGLSFLFNSPNCLKLEIPLDLAATRKINKNSSIDALFKLAGHFIDFKFVILLTLMSAISSALYSLLFVILILAFILLSIFKIPILEELIFTSLIKMVEFLDSNVRTMKKDAELISPGTL